MLLLWAGWAQAATLTVNAAGGADFVSISEAMLASSDGDLIDVADGFYEEALVFPSYDLRVVASGSAVLSSDGFKTPTVTMTGNSSATELSGFELIPRAGQSAVHLDQASPLLSRLLIQDYIAGSGGDVLLISYGGAPTLTDSTIRGMWSVQPTIKGNDSDWTIRSCTFSDNYIDSSQHINVRGSLVLQDSILTGLSRRDHSVGAGVVDQSCSSQMECHVVISNNTWGESDGRLLDVSAETVAIEGEHVEGGESAKLLLDAFSTLTASELELTNASLVLTAQEIALYSVSLQGGEQLRLDASQRISAEDLNISGLQYPYYSSAPVDMVAAEIELLNSTVADVVAVSSVVEMRADLLFIDGLTVSNTQSDLGQAMELAATETELVNLRVLQNTGYSSALSLGSRSVLVRDSEFLNNSGGGLAVVGEDIVVSRNSFCGNTGTSGGGAWFSRHGSLQITNNSFSDNQASVSGGGLYVDTPKSSDQITNNTFVANAAPAGSGLDVYDWGTQYPEVTNNVFAFHTGQAFYGATLSYTGLWENEEDYLYEEGSTHEQRGEPRFVDYTPDGVCNDKLWTQVDSPYRDAGDPSIKDPDGSVSDLGISGGPDVDAEIFDGDGDGVPLSEDCDDTNTAVGDQEEVPYDGLDNDCDESTPDDDLDGDGFDADEDCDDTNAEIYPGSIDCGGEAPEPSELAAQGGCSCSSGPEPRQLLWAGWVCGLLLIRRRKPRETSTLEG